MLDYFLKHTPIELVAVVDDPDVIATLEPLAIAHTKLTALEAEEKRLIRLGPVNTNASYQRLTRN